MARPAGFFFAVLLALLFLLPAPCLAADSTAKPAPNSAARAVLDPDMDEGHRQFAHANYDKALEHYLKALEVNKENAYLHFRIGMTYYMLDIIDKSRNYLHQSYELNPTIPNRYGIEIKGECMAPVLQSGDVIFVNDNYFDYNKYGYNDIVYYKVNYYGEVIPLVQRIIGLPGDLIRVVDNKVYRNEVGLNEKYANFSGRASENIVSNMDTVEVQHNKLFVMTDDRNPCYDSRILGQIEKSSVIGKPLVIIKSNRKINGEGDNTKSDMVK